MASIRRSDAEAAIRRGPMPVRREKPHSDNGTYPVRPCELSAVHRIPEASDSWLRVRLTKLGDVWIGKSGGGHAIVIVG